VTVEANKPRGFRVDQATIESWLDRLDRRPHPAGAADLRASRRFTYRPRALRLELAQPEGPATVHVVACRNLSREGVGFLTGQFIYPRAACKVGLLSPYDSEQVTAGRVVRCRYLVGSGTLYEVGVRFDRPVDVEVFVPRARLVRVLLVDQSAATHELVASFLGSCHADLSCTTDDAEGLAAAVENDFDLILIDVENPELDAFRLTRRLRAAGFVRPVIGLAVRTDVDLHERCASAGLTGYLSKPVIRETLVELVNSLAEAPLVSSLADDPSMAPLIDGFVEGLHERVTEMSVAMESGDSEYLESLAHGLRAEAGSYGFQPITEEAARLQALIASGEGEREVTDALHQLMDLCLRARPATSPADAAAVPYGRFTGRPPAN